MGRYETKTKETLEFGDFVMRNNKKLEGHDTNNNYTDLNKNTIYKVESKGPFIININEEGNQNRWVRLKTLEGEIAPGTQHRLKYLTKLKNQKTGKILFGDKNE